MKSKKISCVREGGVFAHAKKIETRSLVSAFLLFFFLYVCALLAVYELEKIKEYDSRSLRPYSENAVGMVILSQDYSRVPQQLAGELQSLADELSLIIYQEYENRWENVWIVAAADERLEVEYGIAAGAAAGEPSVFVFDVSQYPSDYFQAGGVEYRVKQFIPAADTQAMREIRLFFSAAGPALDANFTFVADGQPAALEEFYRRYSQSVKAFGARLESVDLGEYTALAVRGAGNLTPVIAGLLAAIVSGAMAYLFISWADNKRDSFAALYIIGFPRARILLMIFGRFGAVMAASFAAAALCLLATGKLSGAGGCAAVFAGSCLLAVLLCLALCTRSARSLLGIIGRR